MFPELFRRPMLQSDRDNRILIDSCIGDASYVESFGFEWTKIDGFIDKEILSYGHIFGRFLLPNNYFSGKTVVDVGCGNGRIGRLIAPKADRYIGLDLSEAVYAFPRYLRKKEIILVQASGTDLPLSDAITDVTVCWGVLHHMNNPNAALEELIRITKPGGDIIIFIYSKAYDARENFNRFVKNIPNKIKHQLIENTSDLLDSWREVDSFYANQITGGVHMSVKQSREWQIFQWYDGVTPQFHWNLVSLIEEHTNARLGSVHNYGNGCYKLKVG